MSSSYSEETLALWHVNYRDLLQMIKNKQVLDINLKGNESLPFCEVCAKSNMTSLPFTRRSSRANKRLEIVHADLCGPMRTESKGRARFLVTFIDDFSRWCEVYFIKNKSDVLSVFKQYKAYAEKQTSEKIKHLQTDNGREFCNAEFDEFLKSHGIRRRLTVPYTPQQNGIAERKNRTLVEMARCLMMQGGLQPSFWAEAVHTANYLRNRCASKPIDGKTPFQMWTGKLPSLQHLRVIGTKAYILDKVPTKGKFDTRAKVGILVGYSEVTKGYRFWVPSDCKIVLSRDVRFLSEVKNVPVGSNEEAIGNSSDGFPEEVEFHFSNPVPSLNNEREDDAAVDDMPIQPEENVRRRPGRPRLIRTGLRGRPRKLYCSTSVPNDGINSANESETPVEDGRVQILDPDVPNEEGALNDDEVFYDANAAEEVAFRSEINFEEAMTGPHSEQWKEAVVQEMKAMLQKNTWELVDRPKNRGMVGSRVVLTKKFEMDGDLNRRKARLVAKGFSQKPGVDFIQTFAPVAGLESLRLLMALAAKYKMAVHQLDIVTAYLNGHLDEEIFMETPVFLKEALEEILKREGKGTEIGARADRMLRVLQKGDKVCLLKRAL